MHDRHAIDISSWQGNVNMAAVARSGVSGIWVRVGGADSGTNRNRYYTDSRADRYLTDAAALGLPHGTYYFARPERDNARAQADHAVEIGYGRGPLWPALDMEFNPTGLAPAQLDDWVTAFCARTHHLTGRDSIIYTGRHFGVGHQRKGHPACPLWIANYGRNDTASTRPPTWEPAIPPAWDRWDMWQFNSVTPIPGIAGNVDQNVVRGEFWDHMLTPTEEDDDMPALASIVRTQIGSEWAHRLIGNNAVSHYLLLIEGNRTVRLLTGDSLNAELFWQSKHIDDVWEVADNFLTGGRYRLDYDPTDYGAAPPPKSEP